MMIAWYKLNGDILDSSGNEKHLTLKGNVPFIEDGLVLNKSTSFSNNVNNGLSTPYFNELSFSNYTISVRFKISSLTGVKRMIISQGRDCRAYGINILLHEDNTIKLLSESSPNLTLDYSPMLNKWYTVTVICDGIKEKCYLDGVLKTESNYIKNNFSESWNLFVIGQMSHGYGIYFPFNGAIQDVRIYDHALSDKEIAELAKAKILHLTFDDVEEPTVNYIPDGNFSKKIYQNPYTGSCYQWSLAIVDGDSSTPCNGNILEFTSASNNSYTDDYIGMETKMCDAAPGDAFTVSCYFRSKNVENIQGNMFMFPMKSNYGYIDAPSLNLSIGKNWTRLEFTYVMPAETIGVSVRMDNYTTGGILQMTGWQLEKKDHATTFVNGTRATATIYDKSDYGNHCTTDVATTPTFTSDCKLGKQSVKYNKTNYIYVDKTNLKPTKEITLVAWININEYDGTTHNTILTLASSYYLSLFNGYLECYAYGRNDGAYYTNSANRLSLNVWYHVSAVISLTQSKLYINGVLVNTFTNSLNNDIQYPTNTNQVSSGLCYPSMSYATNMNVDDLRIYATALTAEQVKELYEVRASLDDKGNLFVGSLTSVPNKKRIFDYSWWNYIGYPSDRIPYPIWDLNGTGDENRFVYDTDPFGKKIIVWRCQDTDAASDDDGGWNSTIPIDKTKKYRFSLWVKRSVAGNGIFFIGCDSVESTAGVTQGNPYWHVVGAGGADEEIQSEWKLMVYYVFPNGYIGVEEPNQGVYKVGKGKVHGGSINRNCSSPVRWTSSAITCNFRAYLYNSTDTTTKQEFCYPRVDLCDGTEPTIDELLNGYDSRNYDTYLEYGNINSLMKVKENGEFLCNEISEIGVVEGLVAWYPLDGHAKDVIGGNDGVVNGASVALGQGQKCYYTDGIATKYIRTPVINLKRRSWSISCWIYKVSNSPGAYSIFWSGGLPYLADGAGNNILRLSYANINAEQDNLTIKQNLLTINQWHYVVATSDSDGLRLYCDGVYLGKSSTLEYGGDNFNNNFDLGRHLHEDAYRCNSKIQDFRIYNRALTPEEVSINYDMTRPDGPAMKNAENGTLYIKGTVKEAL